MSVKEQPIRRGRAGDRVRIKPLAQIIATLDAGGSREGLPFMPEMARFCGRTASVRSRAHKTCDTQYGLGGLRLRARAVHLDDLRCDGSAHGGCQASCLLFWHEDWLLPADDRAGTVPGESGETLDDARATAWSHAPPAPDGTEMFRCQATDAQKFTERLSPFNLVQYVEDVTSGNVGLKAMFWGAYHALFRKLMQIGIGYGVVVRVYNLIQRWRGEPPNPYVAGKLTRTPVASLGLKVGDWVRVRPFDEIMATLDARNRNRGLWFVPEEMGQFCGRTARVARCVDRILDEKSGRMIQMGTPSVVLDNVYCTGTTVAKRLHCPRAAALFWRDIWLERISPDSMDPPPAGSG